MTRHHMIDGEEVPLTAEEEDEVDARESEWAAGQTARELETVRANRDEAYRAEADGLFFQQQRGEIPGGTWEAKVAEIKLRIPKPL